MVQIKYKLILINTVLWCLILLSCGKETEEHAAEKHEHEDNEIVLTEAQYKNAGVALGKLKERSMSGVIKVNGVFDVPPQNLVTISLPYAGIIKQTILLQGMEVKKGQVIAVLEHPDFIQLQQDYLDNKSKLDYLQLEVNRQQELQKENVNSAKVFQKAQAEYESLKAIVSGLKEKLSMININTEQLFKNGISKQVKVTAPINGFITKVNVNIGKLINPNEVICEIVDIGHLHVELTVFEKDVANLKVGQKVRFFVNNETMERKAFVYLIGKEIGPDRTVRVHCHLDKEDKSMLPGMYLTAYVETNQKQSKVLPSSALVGSGNKNYVFISKGKEKESYAFEKVEVSIGIVEDNFTEVILPPTVDQQSDFVLVGAYDLWSALQVDTEEGHSH
ncbi:MAG: efflux transporter periplasmic adaptor subunit [Cytophagaceae bacterium]|jgi:cobalt-zinc-cadmium efflux system membrane fusion protein|nr:efflux transporter periplasmic adaptor subunit [Cytophagaceae bacterium]